MQKQNLAGPVVDKLSLLPMDPVNIKTNRVDQRAFQQVFHLWPPTVASQHRKIHVKCKSDYVTTLSGQGNGVAFLSEEKPKS